jgi:hypothetical protein
MGQLLHGSARTPTAVLRAIHESQESLAKLAARYGLTPKIIAKWKKRPYVHDAPIGLKQPHSPVLTKEEEALVVTFRPHTLLPLDDGLDTLHTTIPHRTRSALHRYLTQHGISHLPAIECDSPQKKQFKPYPIGYYHTDMVEVRTEEGKLSSFVAIDGPSTFSYAELDTEAIKPVMVQFMRNLIITVHDKFHPILLKIALSGQMGNTMYIPSNASLQT